MTNKQFKYLYKLHNDHNYIVYYKNTVIFSMYAQKNGDFGTWVEITLVQGIEQCECGIDELSIDDFRVFKLTEILKWKE